MKQVFKRKNLHLLISLVIVLPAALIYGLFPSISIPYFLDFEVESVDLKSIFRAIMGLYIGITLIWLLGVFKSKYWDLATLCNIVFMGGIGLGRLLGVFIDGIPSPVFSLGIVGELGLSFFAYYQWRRYSE
ncbi:DUF4345 domain-containing protein [Eudoraea chungangensis]|uniref:DUF4345 domain-containing protein n=1 Tax=Eudoraea chungangensis TaxID=1481905 RepID=UPI0023EE227E|nr:DUF4345 domain-containing protein [Eudoraea chungangensis]